MQNKEVREKLVKYYRKQDIEIIYILLANAQIDFNRLDNMEDLRTEEKINLFKRIRLNSAELRKFVRQEDNDELLIFGNIE